MDVALSLWAKGNLNSYLSCLLSLYNLSLVSCTKEAFLLFCGIGESWTHPCAIGAKPQNSLHMLRDCPGATQVWRMIVPTGWWILFCRSVNSVQCFRTNQGLASCGEPESCNWLYIFRQTVHDLWYNHTSRKHDDRKLMFPRALAERSLQTVADLLSVSVGNI